MLIFYGKHVKKNERDLSKKNAKNITATHSLPLMVFLFKTKTYRLKITHSTGLGVMHPTPSLPQTPPETLLTIIRRVRLAIIENILGPGIRYRTNDSLCQGIKFTFIFHAQEGTLCFSWE